MKSLAVIIMLGLGCATAPPGPGAAICLDGECARIPNVHAEFLMDWCEYKLPEAEAQQLEAWSESRVPPAPVVLDTLDPAALRGDHSGTGG